LNLLDRRWALALVLLLGCDLIEARQGQLEASMRRAGLVESWEQVGPARLHVWSGGEGPTVLLLHGFGAETIWQWPAQVRALIGDHRLVLPDLLWFGGSESTDRDFRIERQVDAVEALLESYGEERVAVVGISYGGLVAHELGSRRPDLVPCVALLDSPGRAYTDADYAALLERFGVEHPAPLLVPTDGAGVQRLVDLAYFRPPTVPESVRQQILTHHYDHHSAEKVELLEAVVGQMDELRAQAKDLAVPTLLLWGEQDPVFPVEIGRRLKNRLGDLAELQVIPRAKHAPNLEHPAVVNRALREFFDGRCGP